MIAKPVQQIQARVELLVVLLGEAVHLRLELAEVLVVACGLPIVLSDMLRVLVSLQVYLLLNLIYSLLLRVDLIG